LVASGAADHRIDWPTAGKFNSPRRRPVSLTKELNMSTKPTLNEWYTSQVRPKLFKRLGKKRTSYYDSAVSAALAWRSKTIVDDIGSDWLNEFRGHLRSSSGFTPKYQTKLVQRVRLIAWEHHPYRLMYERMSWTSIRPVLLRESTQYIGCYYVKVFEPRLQWTKSSVNQVRISVKRFLAWCNGPILLNRVDDAQLRRFEASEIEKGISALTARVEVAHIRGVVNHRYPGRLADRKHQAPVPSNSSGSVQAFFEKTVFKSKWKPGEKNATLKRMRSTMWRLHEFNEQQDLEWSRFTYRLCTDFLSWCVTDGGSDGPVSDKGVSNRIRSHLKSLSAAAKKAGLIEQRLDLDPIAPSWKSRKPSPPKSKKAGKRGPQGAYWHLNEWLVAELGQGDAKPFDLRERYTLLNPNRPLPKYRSFSGLVSKARKKAREPRATVSK
jgi:hypothetical protein